MTKYTHTKDSDARTVESVVVRGLHGSHVDFICAFTKEARLLHDLKRYNLVGF